MPGYSFETYGELDPWQHREWLQTNGTGAFAASTVICANARRYHGLLVAATVPPIGRVVALNRLSETIRRPGVASVELAVNYFHNAMLPRGEQYLRSFSHYVTTRWVYAVDGIQIEKELMLCWRRNVTAVRYTIHPDAQSQDGAQAAGPIEFGIQPFVTLRDFHSLMRADWHSEVYAGTAGNSCTVRRWGHELALACAGTHFKQRNDWWYSFKYPIETERGQDDTEDLFTPGEFTATISEPTTLTFVAGLEPIEGFDWNTEYERRLQNVGDHQSPSIPQKRLARAANDFVVDKRVDDTPGKTILAGYPWFSDWGRDTMIALPGLLLTTGRYDQAGQVLSTFARYVSEGMIPNVFDDYSGTPQYNTVDASLWFIHAAFEYARSSKDRDTFDSLLQPACRQIIDGYKHGTRFGIKMDLADGLMTQGDPSTQLTWMDAKTNGVVFAPRHGKAVEINALWYNALKLMQENDLAGMVKASFQKMFWISSSRGLADVVNETGRSDAMRPNQIFAVSLPHSPLTHEQQRAVVDAVRRELLTPYGLRTLSPGDPKFEPYYTGQQFDRDKAYHHGTIWPWLIGAFLEAHLKVNHRSAEALRQARRWLLPLVESLETGCIGSISECYEAAPPHRPVGTFAQAWSVAEVLRLAVDLDM
jgi:predicted glycogen debranching enzyme